MKFIIGLFLFWLSVVGITLFINNRFKINKYFIIPIVFSLIGIFVFISGLLNIINIISVMICIFGICYLIYYLKNNKFSKDKLLKMLKDPYLIIIFIIFVYITLLGLNMKLTHYDNFSHWGLIVKTMFEKGALPNYEDNFILFKGYQPGSACFIYYFGLLAGKSEGAMIIAQNYLILSFLLPILAFIKKDNKLIKIIVFVFMYIFVLTTSIKFSDLLVDSLLGVMLLSSILIMYFYKKDLKKAFSYSLPVIIYMFLVKNVGLVFALMATMYLLYIAYQNKKLKKGILYSFIIMIILAITLLLWQSHVKMVYGSLASESKHSLTVGNMLVSIKNKGISNIVLFGKIYLSYMFDLSKNVALIYMLVLNIISLIYLCFKDKILVALKKLLVINGIYIFYCLILGLMYILSMPLSEATALAGIDRYLLTIVVFIVGICIVYIFEKNYKNKLTNIIIYIIVLILLIIPSFFNKENVKVMFGNDGYKNSVVQKVDLLIDKVEIKKDINYYIYSPSSVNDGGYLSYIFKYKLSNNNVLIINNYNDINTISTGKLVMYDTDDNLINMLNSDNWKKVNDYIYEK